MAANQGKLIDGLLSTFGTNNSSQISTAILAGFKMIFIPAATARDKKATPEQKKYTMTRDVITEGLALSTYLGVTGMVQKHATAPICSIYYKNKAKMIEAGKIKTAAKLTAEELDFLKHVDAKKINEVGMDFVTQKGLKHKVASPEAKEYITKLQNIVTKANGISEDIKSISLDQFSKNLAKNGIPKEKKGFSVLIDDFKNAAKGSPKLTAPKNLFQNTRIALSQVSVWVLALAVIPPLCNIIISPVMKKLNATKKQDNSVATLQQPKVNVNNPVKKRDNTTFKSNYYANMSNLGNMRVG